MMSKRAAEMRRDNWRVERWGRRERLEDGGERVRFSGGRGGNAEARVRVGRRKDVRIWVGDLVR